MQRIIILLILLIVFVSCATIRQTNIKKVKYIPEKQVESVKIKKIVNQESNKLKSQILDNKTGKIPLDIKTEIKKEFRLETKEELEKEISEIHEDLFINNHIKIEINNEVRKFIRLYSKHNGRWLYNAFKRAYIWLPYMKQIFKEYGLPEELVYISFIESHFHFKSRSYAGAVGPWQFMRRTAKKYGLKINWWIDERCDPIKSTVAAAKYLKYLYNLFGSYDLALAGYNAGEYKILKAIKRYKTKDYWKICKKRFLKKETKSYVPSFYAVLFLIRNNARLHFVPDKWINYKKKNLIFVQISKPYSLYSISKKTGIPLNELKELNPELKRGITPPFYENYLIKVPKKYETQMIALAKRIEKDYKYTFKTYRIRKGDSLYKIAKRFGIYPISIIAKFNNIKNPRRLRINQRILLPIPQNYKPHKVFYAKVKRRKSHKVIIYKVRKGDSLWKVSNRFNVSVRELISWNNLSSKTIYPGDILKIKIR